MADWGNGAHWWGWVPAIVATAVFWALVIWAIVVLVRWARSGGNGPRGPDGPGSPGGPRDARRPGDDDDGAGRALAHRHASGEIDSGEYHRRAATLGR